VSRGSGGLRLIEFGDLVRVVQGMLNAEQKEAHADDVFLRDSILRHIAALTLPIAKML